VDSYINRGGLREVNDMHKLPFNKVFQIFAFLSRGLLVL